MRRQTQPNWPSFRTIIGFAPTREQYILLSLVNLGSAPVLGLTGLPAQGTWRSRET